MFGAVRDLVHVDVIVSGAQSEQLSVWREFHDLGGTNVVNYGSKISGIVDVNTKNVRFGYD